MARAKRPQAQPPTPAAMQAIPSAAKAIYPQLRSEFEEPPGPLTSDQAFRQEQQRQSPRGRGKQRRSR